MWQRSNLRSLLWVQRIPEAQEGLGLPSLPALPEVRWDRWDLGVPSLPWLRGLHANRANQAVPAGGEAEKEEKKRMKAGRTDKKRKDGGLKKAAGAKCSVTEHQVQTLCLFLPKVQEVLSLQQLLVILARPEIQLSTHLVSEQQHIIQVSHTHSEFV